MGILHKIDIIMNEESQNNKIMKIVTDIKSYDKSGDIERMFMDGYCYDFAHMICRNMGTGCEIIFSKDKEKDGHYSARYKNKYYDIRGEIEEPDNIIEVETLD